MDRPHPPTPRRLRRALAAGDSPLSRAAVQASVLLVCLCLVPALSRALDDTFTELLHRALAAPESMSVGRLGAAVLTLLWPLVAAGAATAVAVTLVQTRGTVTFRRTAGARRGLRGYDAWRGLVITGALLLTSLYLLATSGLDLGHAASLEVRAFPALGLVANRAVQGICGVLLGFAAMDVVVKQRAWRGRLRMSSRELARERRDDEGAPEIKRARQRAEGDLAREAPPPGTG